ncbi:MAG: hypothetical protein MJ062_04270 [Oscillospiraceae bacterium]|nr:hypothetical protein [Oscillospiraceae bacterium]
MSEIVYRLITTDPDMIIPREIAASAADFLKEQLHAEKSVYVIADAPMFVDCGTALRSIQCPHCHKPLPFHWWVEQMGRCSDSDFAERNVFFPCCKKDGLLEEIDYVDPCGVSRVVFEVHGAQNCPDSETLNTLRFLLNCDLRVIRAVY